MSSFICRSCRTALRQGRVRARHNSTYTMGAGASITSSKPPRLHRPENSADSSPIHLDVEALLSADHPTWSVHSLLPSPKDKAATTEPITSKQLHHLLRLSALPLPKDAEEEAKMLKVLETQLGFVRAIREVKTDGVESLVMLRDESAEGVKANTIGLETEEIRKALQSEVVRGRNGRPRRVVDEGATEKNEMGTTLQKTWNVLETAEHKVGSYFVVRSGKPVPGTETIKTPKPFVRKYISTRLKPRDNTSEKEKMERGQAMADGTGRTENEWKELATGFTRETPSQRAVMLNLELAAEKAKG